MKKIKMARTAGTKKKKVTPEQAPKKENKFFDFLRFGESYTSLVLGIIAVIIATALLLAFVHTKNAHNVNTPINEQAQTNAEISQQAAELSAKAPSGIVDNAVTITVAPTDTIAPTTIQTATPTPIKKPKHIIKAKHVVKPTVTVKVTPKVIAKAKPTAKVKPHPVVKKIVQVHPDKKVVTQKKAKNSKNVWIVQKGESLWTIAEEKYTSGYNWVDIARANNLSDPSDIHVGDKLILPNVTPKVSTIATVVAPKATVTSKPGSTIKNTSNTKAITGNTYMVVRGDNLWNIAVRAYGDGFKWTQIAQANNLANPRMIFSGNVLTIPR